MNKSHAFLFHECLRTHGSLVERIAMQHDRCTARADRVHFDCGRGYGYHDLCLDTQGLSS